MAELLSFFIIIAAGLVLSEIFNRLHIPWVVALIAAGLVIGPHGFNILQTSPTITFLSEVGLIFLMFMAGLETRLSALASNRKGVLVVSLLNGLVPFLIAVQIGLVFGYDLTASLLLGSVFISSSIAVVIPLLSKNKLLHTRLGNVIVSTTMLEDIVSLIILSILLQTSLNVSSIPLPLFYLLMVIALVALRYVIPRIQKRLLPSLFLRFRKNKQEDLFQQELRLVLVMLIGIVIIFELLGLHPIIAGFFAGLVLSQTIQSEKLYDKLKVLSYGVFVPIFFVDVGLDTNLSVLVTAQTALPLVVTLVGASLAAKFLGGFVGGRFSGFDTRQSTVIGTATLPQLTTTLAVAFAGAEFGLFDDQLVTALVILSLLSTLLGPIITHYLIKRFNITS